MVKAMADVMNSPQTVNLKAPRMETIHCTSVILNIPEHFVRAKVLSGEVVAVKAGRKYLVNIDKFIDFLNGETVTEAAPQCSSSDNAPRIAPIPLR